MAFEDRMQGRMERQRERDARKQERDAERDARRLSRMADQPLRTPSMPPMIDNRPTMPPMVDNRPMPRPMPRPPLLSGESAGFPGVGLGGGIGSLFGGGTNALTTRNPNRFPLHEMLQPPQGQTLGSADPYTQRLQELQQMSQPDQSYGSWLSSQLRSGVDFERMGIDPMQIYNQSSNRPLPNVEPMTQLGQMPTQPGGKGGQMPTQPGGKGAYNQAYGPSISALGMFR